MGKTLKKRGGQVRSFPIPITEFKYGKYRECSDFRFHIKKETTFYQCDVPYNDMDSYVADPETGRVNILGDIFVKGTLDKDVEIHYANAINALSMSEISSFIKTDTKFFDQNIA